LKLEDTKHIKPQASSCTSEVLAGLLTATQSHFRGWVTSEAAARDAAADTTSTTVSNDAYRRNAAGSITIAVTGTDNPVPTEQGERQTPPQVTPAVTSEQKDQPPRTEVGSKRPKRKQP
jgi:hypothetical protein